MRTGGPLERSTVSHVPIYARQHRSQHQTCRNEYDIRSDRHCHRPISWWESFVRLFRRKGVGGQVSSHPVIYTSQCNPVFGHGQHTSSSLFPRGINVQHYRLVFICKHLILEIGTFSVQPNAVDRHNIVKEWANPGLLCWRAILDLL